MYACYMPGILPSYLGRHSFNTFFRWERVRNTLAGGPASLRLLTRHLFIQFLMPQQSVIQAFDQSVRSQDPAGSAPVIGPIDILRFFSPRSRWMSLIRSPCGRHTTNLLGSSHASRDTHTQAYMLSFLFMMESLARQLVANSRDYGGDTRPAFSEIHQHPTSSWGHGIFSIPWHWLRINPE